MAYRLSQMTMLPSKSFETGRMYAAVRFSEMMPEPVHITVIALGMVAAKSTRYGSLAAGPRANWSV